MSDEYSKFYDMFNNYITSWTDKDLALEKRIEKLETNCKGSFIKVENHITRILEVMDKHTMMIEELEKKLKDGG